MDVVVINGSEIENNEQLHDVLSKELHFPPFYGRNLDALWDCLTGHIELPVTIMWRNFYSSKLALGEYADKVAEVLKAAESAVPGLSIIIS